MRVIQRKPDLCKVLSQSPLWNQGISSNRSNNPFAIPPHYAWKAYVTQIWAHVRVWVFPPTKSHVSQCLQDDKLPVSFHAFSAHPACCIVLKTVNTWVRFITSTLHLQPWTRIQFTHVMLTSLISIPAIFQCGLYFWLHRAIHCIKNTCSHQNIAHYRAFRIEKLRQKNINSTKS